MITIICTNFGNSTIYTYPGRQSERKTGLQKNLGTSGQKNFLWIFGIDLLIYVQIEFYFYLHWFLRNCWGHPAANTLARWPPNTLASDRMNFVSYISRELVLRSRTGRRAESRAAKSRAVLLLRVKAVYAPVFLPIDSEIWTLRIYWMLNNFLILCTHFKTKYINQPVS